MSKVTITKPVGYLYQTGPHKVVDLRLFDEIPQNIIVSSLITTDQAEDYANARVREALEWRPIETAPKDGTWIAAWRNIEGPLIGDPLVFVRWFDFDDEPGWAWPSKPYNPWTFEGQEQAIQCIEEGDWYSSDELTHWMPLPAPPSDAAMEKQP